MKKSTENLILFDDNSWNNLLPLTYTRPVSELRVGITIIKEKWEHYFSNISYLTQDYLSELFACKKTDRNLLVNSSIIPNDDLVECIISIAENEVLVYQDKIIALYQDDVQFPVLAPKDYKQTVYNKDLLVLENPWDIFLLNGKLLEMDFTRLTNGRKSQPISKNNNILATENIFVEEGAKVEFATIDAQDAYVYIGKNATIMPGVMISGSLALCEHSTIKMGAKIYGPTTIGPHSKVAGEVQNSVIEGYSNKAHDGFLGNSVLGYWCNLGADTNTSNLKNNYAQVKLWNYEKKRFSDTGLQFCGLIMGDHSKCGINTMFNTGTVVGVSANIFGAGFPRNFIPSFSWGGAAGFSLYRFDKAMEVAEIVYARRKKELTKVEREILLAVYNMTEKYYR